MSLRIFQKFCNLSVSENWKIGIEKWHFSQNWATRSFVKLLCSWACKGFKLFCIQAVRELQNCHFCEVYLRLGNFVFLKVFFQRMDAVMVFVMGIKQFLWFLRKYAFFKSKYSQIYVLEISMLSWLFLQAPYTKHKLICITDLLKFV